ncbi:substrate-binding domain-containing protein [Plantactinospora mayteni]|uniref:PBP domain-containing protein n=1 Tax=Plantactinospora mayteni TaxID=566021 RepID=A0ABQ4EI71_9ACTN|nr:hypothetical protein Pma05_09120 [Plantactinospora mayteni]
MQVRIIVAAVGAALVAAVGVAAGAGPAAADPNPVTDYRTLAGVGSDTTQDVLNGLGEAITVGGQKAIASWDARGTATVKTKATGCELARPNGSSAGRTALRDSKLPASPTAGCVDFARSSSGTTNVPAGTGTWIPFGVDAVTFAINRNSDLPINMSVALLQNIYKCVISHIGGIPIQPLLLQAGSGTRQFWNGQMSITDQEIALGDYPCLVPASPSVPDGSGLPEVQEHDARVLEGHTDYLMPYSIAQHIAQGNSLAGVEDRRGPSELGRINTVSPYAAGTTPPNEVLNVNFPLRRTVYNIVPTADLNNSVIDQVFTGADSLICQQGALIQRYGFGVAADCGSVVLRGNL